MIAGPDFETLLKQTMGLDSVSIGKTSIERSVRHRMERLAVADTDDYWHRLQTSAEELQELIETVVVPETWFFRDESAFAALARVALEQWRLRHPKTGLRLLSLPCSTGEEPYSMMMTLLDCGFDISDIHIDAVDISSRVLARATLGVYGSNSFRGQNTAFRDRYFQPAQDGYSLIDRLCGRVRFRQANLLSADFRPGEIPYDAIFCRNLLIYFDRATQEQVLRKLGTFLSPAGYLFVGAAEAFLASCNGFTPVNQPMAFAFRKGPVAGGSAVKAPTQSRPKLAGKQSPYRGQQPTLKTNSVDDGVPDVRPTIDEIRGLADAGQLHEAAALCEVHIRKQGTSAEAYYLLGLVQDAQGDPLNATASYRRALYLAPDHTEALSHLALLLEAQGDLGSAERLRERHRRSERLVGGKSA
jgi:chemotaxis protein methyltransferase WspC